MALLQIRDLIKTFPSPEGGVQTVLDVPAFSLEPGEQVALEGTSGSGKTTLLNVIAGILRPDKGSVLLGGVDMTGLSEAQRDQMRASALGYVFQTFNLLQGYTALENVLLGMMFGPGPDRALAKSLLEDLGLGDRLDYRLTFEAMFEDGLWKWEIDWTRADGGDRKKISGDSFAGSPVSGSQMKGLRTDARPRLNNRVAVETLVLSLVDGKRTVDQIVEEVARRLDKDKNAAREVVLTHLNRSYLEPE